MPYIFSALVPHSPLLIEEVAKENYGVFKQTLLAYQKIKEKLETEQVAIVIIISSPETLLLDGFGLGVAWEYKTNLVQFGCFMEKKSFQSPISFSRDLLHFIYKDQPLKTINQTSLDYTASIPLELLINKESKIKVLPILCNDNLSLEKHFHFGQKLAEFLKTREEKLALVISGDLSHRITKSSPAGYSPKGQKFDNRLMEYLNKPNSAIENILKFDEVYLQEVKESVLRPLLVSLGVNNADYQPEKLVYQNDFGVGYLSFLFK